MVLVFKKVFKVSKNKNNQEKKAKKTKNGHFKYSTLEKSK